MCVVLARLQTFLPSLAEANQKLVGVPQEQIDIEHVSGNGPYIRMVSLPPSSLWLTTLNLLFFLFCIDLIFLQDLGVGVFDLKDDRGSHVSMLGGQDAVPLRPSDPESEEEEEKEEEEGEEGARDSEDMQSNEEEGVGGK